MVNRAERRRTVREAAVDNGWTPEDGSPWVGPDGVTYESKDAFYAAAGLGDQEAPTWLSPAMRAELPAGVGKGLVRLSASVVAMLEARAAQDLQVGVLRGLGATWDVIAMALGVSAEGARSHYGRTQPPVRRRPRRRPAAR